jgi:DNA-binding NarL/FixJ family response regulator
MHRRYLSSEVKLPKVVLTAPFFSETLLLSAIRSGVADLVTEGDGVEALFDAIRAANQVNAETSYSELKTFFELQNVEPGSNPRWLLRLTDLSTRESSVLEQLEMGLSDSEISEKLGLTETTIRRAISTLMSRMGVATRAQFALALFEAGVLFSKKPSKKTSKSN